MTRFGLRAAGVAVVVLVAATSAARAQAQPQKLLTLDDLYDPAKKVDFGAPPVRGSAYTWVNDNEYLRVKDTRTPQGARAEIVRVNAVTGAETPLFDQARLAAALGAVPGISADDAARLSRLRTYVMNPARTALLVNSGNDLFLWTFGAERVVRLTWSAEAEDEVTFSPDGRLVAFVRAHNLYVVDLEGHERALTTDGHAQRLNGQAGLGLSGRDLRARHAPRLLVESGLVPPHLPATRRDAGARVHRRRSHPLSAERRGHRLSEGRAIPTRL